MSLCLNGAGDGESSQFEGTALEDYNMKLRNLEWYTSVLVPKLVEALSAAVKHPHDACYASRCLGTLGEAHSDFADQMKDVGLQSALENAEDVGQSQFRMLFQEIGN